jgi:hypothetical protein
MNIVFFGLEKTTRFWGKRAYIKCKQLPNTQRTGTFMVAKAWDVHFMQKKLTAF